MRQTTEELFLQIKKAYNEYEAELQSQGKKLVRETAKGIYGVSDCDVLFAFFKKIHLTRSQHFIDLGCGDGRAVLIASLFTPHAVGIEADEELVAIGLDIASRLSLDADVRCSDFLFEDLSPYDVLFINPDKGFHKGLDAKLQKEIGGKLYVYNEIFAPESLRKGKKFWFGQIPIIEYMRKSIEVRAHRKMENAER